MVMYSTLLDTLVRYRETRLLIKFSEPSKLINHLTVEMATQQSLDPITCSRREPEAPAQTMKLRNVGSSGLLRGAAAWEEDFLGKKKPRESRLVSLAKKAVARRQMMMGEVNAAPKACFLLFVTMCILLLCWGSDGKTLHLWKSRAEREREEAYKNLDPISIALLKLGLPVSPYALYMRKARSVGAVSPSVQVGTRTRRDSGLGWTVSGSQVSIYSVASTYKYSQQLWVFQDACYNGSHLIRFETETCREPQEAAPHGPLTPVGCKNVDFYLRRLASVSKDTGIPSVERPISWIETRDSIVWRNETVAIANLDRNAVDPARFLHRVNMLLLLNNASTVPAFLDQVDLFWLTCHPRVTKLLKGEGDGEDNLHRAYLSTMLARAAPVDEVVVWDTLDGVPSLADSPVQLNDPLASATEEKPLCFRKAVLTGAMKGSCWPGGEAVADLVRGHFIEKFGTKTVSKNSGEWPRLVVIMGNHTKRILSPTSEVALQSVLNNKALGVDVHMRDISSKSFAQQFETLQSADIVAGFYGPDIILPATFSRKLTLLVEILPFRVLDRAHESQALDSGLVYMGYRCEEGLEQPDDPLFRDLSASACLASLKCKQYYAIKREVNFTENDLYQIRKLVSLARLIASEIGVLTQGRSEFNHTSSSSLIRNLIGGKSKCRPLTRADLLSASCPEHWLSFVGVDDIPMTCCY